MGTRVTFDNLTQLATNEASAVETINQNFDDVETQIDDFVSRTGTGTNMMQVQLDMNNNKIINVGDGSNAADGINKSQLDDQVTAIRDLLDAGNFAGPSVSNGGSIVQASPTDINFGDGLTATSDGDGTVSVAQAPSTTQSYFFARHAAADDQTNVTGAGAVVTPTYSDVEYNVGSDYDGTNVYTAPVDGLYTFNMSVFATGGGGAEVLVEVNFVHSARGTFTTQFRNIDFLDGTVGLGCLSFTVPMNANDTMKITYRVAGETSDALDITNTILNWFSGALIREL